MKNYENNDKEAIFLLTNQLSGAIDIFFEQNPEYMRIFGALITCSLGRMISAAISSSFEDINVAKKIIEDLNKTLLKSIETIYKQKKEENNE